MKKNTKLSFLLINLLILIVLVSCHSKNDKNIKYGSNQPENELAFTETLNILLQSIETKNLDLLKSTMSPKGNMQLILPQSKITNKVDEFVAMHEEWFKDKSWTMDTKILNARIGEKMGMATTEAMYREPERNGKPYFNHMVVSYVLEKIDGKWYVIKDHASSIEKTKN